MKNLESLNGQMGAELAEGEARVIQEKEQEKEKEKEKDSVVSETESLERDQVTSNGVEDGKLSPKHRDSTEVDDSIVSNKGDYEVEHTNDLDEEDEVSSVSLSQSTDFEISPIEVSPPDVSLSKEVAEDLKETDDTEKPEETSAEQSETSQNCQKANNNTIEVAEVEKEQNEEEVVIEEESSPVKVNGDQKEQVEQKEVEGKLVQSEEQTVSQGGEGTLEGVQDSSQSSPSRINEVKDDKNKEAASQGLKDPMTDDEDSKSSSIVLMSMFVDDCKEPSEDGQKKEIKKVDEDNSKQCNKVSLESVDPDDEDDAYVSDDGSVDINLGLENCFKNLEKKIAEEAEEEESKKDGDVKIQDKQVEEKAGVNSGPKEKTEEEQMEEEM